MICSSSSEDEEEEDIPDYNTPGNKLQVPNGSAPRLVFVRFLRLYDIQDRECITNKLRCNLELVFE